ncbi:MAG TPA: efflux RND transporter periplasmic adaptor subunit, partial [Kofleriaceae bacterium]|nr:efflux RND transporter periplasmic adaptor subunit [Kofleriaceae bacterium]
IEPPVPGLLDERTRREAKARLAAAVAHASRANAAIERAQVARDAATREAKRAQTLFEREAITAAERDQAADTEQLALRDLAAAQTERASAVAEADAIRAQLGEASPQDKQRIVTVTAPISGRVLRVVRDSGGPVATGAPLVELGDTQSLEVVVDVLSSDAARIHPGMPVAIEAWGGDKNLSGTVAEIEPSAFTRISALGVEEQRVKVIVGLSEPPPTLGDGFRVEARIFTWQGTNVLTIPTSAVFRDHGRWAVYAVEGGKARLRRIELGHRGRLDVEVVSGITAGEAVVLHPSDRIRDGVKLTRYAHETP